MSPLRMARSRSVLPTVLATVLLGAVPLISACGAGQNAPTKQEYSVTDGVSAHAGNVVLRNLLLTADVGDTLGGASNLALQGVIANNTGANDKLTGVVASSIAFTSSPAAASGVPSSTPAASASAGGASASATGAAASASAAPVSATVAPGIPLVLGTPGLGLQVSGLKPAVLPGSLVSLTFSFQQSGDVTVEVPVYALSSRTATPGPTVTYPTPDVPDGFNQSEFDNQAPASS